MANSSINLLNLDFNTSKDSLKAFLTSNTSPFKDYNFDSSAINMLLDVLAYNTYRNSFYLNMVNAEGFIDSAQMQSSVFSHAKELNYLPRSTKSAVANVTISFSASGESKPYIIRKGETFSTIIKQNSYVFSTATDQIVTSSNNTFNATFDIYEGSYVADSYIVSEGSSFESYTVSNKLADIDSISVLVYEDGLDIPKSYSRATTLLGLTSKSEVYFVQPSFDGKYEVIFGDGVIGKRPATGSTIILDYRVTSGAEGNGATNFVINFDPTGSGELLSFVSVSTNPFSPATTGAYSVDGNEAESIESVRYYAPRHFQTQERAVTADDYSILLKNQFPEIGAISVYGGEEASPPRYGKVFVAIDIKNVDGLPDSKKTEYYSFLKSRSPLSIDPIFVEPQFTFVQVNSTVKYNINTTTRTAQNIQAATVLNISEYADTNLNNFNAKIRYSKLVQSIDSVDTSIVGNETDLVLYKKIKPILDRSQNFILNFNTVLQETDYVNENSSSAGAMVHKIRVNRTIRSSAFNFNGDKCIIEDDGMGVLRIVKTVANYHYVVKNIGTVNYTTGELRLNNLNIAAYDGNALKIYAKTRDKDIMGSKNEVMSIESDEINVKVEAIRE